jgi:PKD repeat protein
MIAFAPASKVAKANTQQASLSFSLSTVNATALDQTFNLSIDISNVQNLWGWIINVTYNSAFVKYTSSSDGSFLTSQGASDFFINTAPQTYKDIYSNIETMQVVTLQDAIGSFSNGEEQSVSGSGTLATVTFQAVNQTSSTSVTLGVEELDGPLPTSATQGAPHPAIIPASYTSTATVSLIIPGPPTANAGMEQSVPAGTQVVLNGSESVSTGSNTTYTWTFTDGTLKTLTGMIAHYTFDNPGNYTVTLTVKDSLGTSNSTVVIHVIGSSTATPTPAATAAATQAPTSSPTPTAVSQTPTATPQQTASSSNLPPTVVGILVFVTICVFAGSFFWLRKQT